MIISITKENHTQDILQATLPVIIDVYANWCGPCQQMAPIFEELSREFQTKCIFAKMNVDESRELSIQYGITSIPTFIFIKNGQVKSKEVGYISKEDMKDKITAFIS